jgi:hypothetical protein
MKTTRTIRWLVFGVLMFSLSAASFAQIAVGISVRFGPPAIPVYEQPVCPGAGYLWTPGYWAWDDVDGYYWVPGTWVLAPVGLLWTPGYWGWGGGFYAWHPGYWGPHVGFYGGINYGFGYTGVGFFGGEWRGRAFFYNRAVMNVNVTRITNVYERTVVVNNNRVAYNGGEGGIQTRPTAEEERYGHEQHTAALAAQRQQERAASRNRQLFASENHGRPAIAATARPGAFKGRGVVAAREAGEPYRAPAMSPREARVTGSEKRGSEARGSEARGSERDNRVAGSKRAAENNRGADREQNRAEQNGSEARNNGREAEQNKAEQRNERRQAREPKANRRDDRQQAKQEKDKQRSEQKQARQEQKQQRQQQKQQAQAQKNQRKQEQHQQKQQREEPKNGDHEGRENRR